MLAQYGPDLLVRCKHASALSSKLVSGWLENWMFKQNEDSKAKATEIAGWLSDHSYFKTHGRHIPREEL
jgi:hypothetical protein